jgi:site-specific recombinase XerD
VEVYDNGTLNWHIYKENSESFNTELIDLKNEYIRFINTNNLSVKTVSLHDFVFRKTVEYLNVKNREDLTNVKREEIEEAMKTFNDCFSQRSMETFIPIIRKIFKLLYDSNYTDVNFAGMIMSSNHFTEYDPAVLSITEEKRII